MTEDKLKKANELNIKIQDITEILNFLNSRVVSIEPDNNISFIKENHAYTLTKDSEIIKEIFKLIIDKYNINLIKLKKEFENL